MEQDEKVPGYMKISGDSMQYVERGLKALAEIADAGNATTRREEIDDCDEAFAAKAKSVAREMTRIANRVKTHPVKLMRVLRGWVAEEAAKASAPRAYGPETQWQSLAAKLILPGIDRAMQKAA